MRDPKRIDRMLRTVEKLWKKYPDMRLGQLLVANGFKSISKKNSPVTSGDIFYQEDDVTERNLKEKLKV